MARTALHPWQKVISKEDFVKKTEEGVWGVGFFKPTGEYYEVDYDSPDYKKHLEVKMARKKARFAKTAKMRNSRIVKIKELRAEVRKTKKEAYNRGKEVGFKQGLAAAKPKLTQADRLRKKQEKVAQLQAEISKLKD